MNIILYNIISDIHNKESTIFKNKILHYQHLYFIIINSNTNVFIHFNEVNIDKIDNYTRDEQSFLFILNSNKRYRIKKYNIKTRELTIFCYYLL